MRQEANPPQRMLPKLGEQFEHDQDNLMKNRTNILIVDDEPNIRLTLRTALDAVGHEVTEAPNGRVALEMMGQRMPGLMILDLSMSVMDGMSLLEELKEVPSSEKPPIIVLTAYGSIAAAVKAMRLGAREFIEKPTTPDDLRATVQAVLAEPPPPDVTPPQELNYDDVLNQVREALREGEFKDAESLLMKAGSITSNDATFLNLAGVFHEASGRKAAARSYYGKAIRANRQYAPAQQNMRRLYELTTLGSTTQSVALGDEQQFVAPISSNAADKLTDRLKRLIRGHG
ncbi:MAG: response regulator [Burkholderiales bacterium]|nr:response regulator [Phycisphaerae bacterium]